LKLDDRIVEYLLGHDVLDARLEGVAVLETGGPPLDALPLAPDTRRALWHLAALWRGPEAPPAFFWGPPGSGKGTAATALARALDRPLLTLDAAALAHGQPEDLPDLLHSASREARLRGAVLHLRHL